ncbi:SDR family oxidoreductase [Mycobacteroides chelonae]|nr:SDR family oxidoreductase [Mycobacteroides chelonae]
MKKMVRRYDNKVALVTGAASGIGRAIAQRLAEEGAEAVVLLDRSAEVNELANTITLTGTAAMPEVVDVTDGGAVDHVVANCMKVYGRLDVVCGAAGILRTGSVAEGSMVVWDQTFDVNVRGQLNVLRASLPVMRGTGGAVCLVSSVSGLVGDRDVAAYAASKAALASLVKQTAFEEAEHGIRCNAVVPGWIDTPINDAVFSSPAQRAETIRATVPLRREGTPPEVAGLVAYLGSDEASYITGTAVLIDGGLLLGVAQ